MIAVRVPDVPVMVNKVGSTVFVLAELLAVSFSTLVPVVGFVLQVGVTPLGRPEAARLTLPVNSFSGVIVMAVATEAPGARVRVAGETSRVKQGTGLRLTVR